MTIRIAIADDSQIALQRLQQILGADRELRVVRSFTNAPDLMAWKDLDATSVVILDVWMPGSSGLLALRALAARVPVVVVSDTSTDSELAREALAQGASAFVSKSELGEEPGEVRLRSAVHAAALRVSGPTVPVIVVVGSTGAPRAIERLVPELRNIPAAVLFIQHLPVHGEHAFARWITGLGLPAQPARNGDVLRAGRAIVAPADKQCVIDLPGVIRLTARQPGDVHAPSGDVTLKSAAFLGRRLIAIVLSGLGDDGADGIADAAAAGATCIAQTPDDAPAPSMPRAALAAARNVRAVPSDALATQVKDVLRRI